MWRRHVCYVCKRSVCGGDEPQPVAHLSHKLQCAHQSLKIMVSYGNKYPRHNARPHVVEQSGQCARALKRHLQGKVVLFCPKLSKLYARIVFRGGKLQKKDGNMSSKTVSTIRTLICFILFNKINK